MYGYTLIIMKKMDKILHCEITNRCPLNCIHCYCKKNYMEKDNLFWENLVDIGIKVGYDKIVISGGEPLLRKDLVVTLLKKCLDNNVKALLLTSGWINEIQFDKNILKNTIIQVSIDGKNSDVHDAFRRCDGSFCRVMNFSNYITDNGGELWVSHAIRKDTIDDINELYDLCDSIGASQLSLNPIISNDNIAKQLVLDRNYLLSIKNKLKSNKRRKIKIYLTAPAESDDEDSSIRICSNGNIYKFGINDSRITYLTENVNEMFSTLKEIIK